MLLGDLIIVTQPWLCFFKNAKMIMCCHYHILDFFTKAPKNISEEQREERSCFGNVEGRT